MPPDAVPASDERTSDQPLTHPDQDLLGVASHAAVLARVVSTTPTPFTIGVYGEWGAGKTTFVHFVEHYLAREKVAPAEPTLFVHFEGWQHRTADELWRALMLKVTRAVYEHTKGKCAVAPHAQAHEDAKTRLRRLLGSYAVGGNPPAEKPQDQYWNFVERLDSTLYGGISKRSPEALRLDQNEAVLAAARASVAALSAASPLVAGLRQLLRIDTTVDTAALFQRERNEATRERIESRREFQDALTSLLELIPVGKRVCVFLDDLDRCMPDVVLDLLEAIKIFLHVEKMVFVVAADEELIGKGLRLRYRELLEGSAGAQEGEFLARKGQEYFEKIIQLRINLPECTPEHAHRFIAAQYPEWMPATDIILSAVGSNPRRLKQYCSWLTFRRSVDQAEREKKKEEKKKEKDSQRRRREKRSTSREAYLPTVMDEERAARAALFEKLIALSSRDAECVTLLHGLAREVDFATLARQMEDELKPVAEPRTGNGASLAGASNGASADGGTAQAPVSDRATSTGTSDGAGRSGAWDGALAGMIVGAAQSSITDGAASATTSGAAQAGTDDDAFPAAKADGAVQDTAIDETPAGRLARLCARLKQSAPLLKHFRFDPALSAYARRDVETLTAMADLRPHPELMLTSGDGPFMRALRHLAQPGTSAPERIFQEDLARLIAVRTSYPLLFAQLLPLANEEWAAGARTLEIALQIDDEEGLAEPWKPLFQQVRQLASATPADASPTALLLQSPLLSEILPEQVLALGLFDTLPDPSQLLPRPTHSGVVTSTEDDRRRLARYVFDTLEPAIRTDILARLELRQWAAAYCLELRGFARLNGLERQWPELARLLRTDRATLRALEDEAMRPGSIAPEHRPVWDRYSGDERLRRFLVLKPLVSDIAPAEVREYFNVSQSIAPAADLSVAPPPMMGVPQAPAARPTFDYVDVSITLEAKDSIRIEEGDSTRCRPVEFEVRLDGSGEPATTITEVPWAQLIEAMPSLYRQELDGPAHALAARDPSQRPRNAESALRAIGALMWRWVFKGEVGKRMQELHTSGAAYRLLLDFPSPLAELPWETLYLKQERSFLGLTQRYSLVRYMKSAAPPAPAAITAPLRILVVLVTPPGTGELDLEAELAAIEEAVRPGVQDGRVLLQVLENEEADPSGLLRALRTFRPHIFHFTGHGAFHEDEGALMLHSADGPHMATASQIANLLRDAPISLAFLNSCNTGTAAENDAITSVAGSLVTAGVPAVIATLRDITDQAGLLFTREWYRAFTEGYPLEAALAEARKRLSVERWDWSAFALFSSTRELDELLFPQGTFRKP
ncbi:MAG TPA: P-loop NTPase fold protein [Longimicrobiaceae bacterium]|jgi:hypothetical protein